MNAPDSTGSHLAARQKKIEDLCLEFPDALIISQYGKPGTISSFWPQYDALFEQIEAAFPKMSCLIMPLGTCASIRSAVAFKLSLLRPWLVVGVDAAGSGLTGQARGTRAFSGLGNKEETLWLAQALPYLDLVAKVDDQATVAASRFLAQAGFFVGASAAASFAAAVGLRARGLLPHRGETVILLPDHGSLYGSNLYSPNFLAQHHLDLAA